MTARKFCAEFSIGGSDEYGEFRTYSVEPGPYSVTLREVEGGGLESEVVPEPPGGAGSPDWTEIVGAAEDAHQERVIEGEYQEAQRTLVRCIVLAAQARFPGEDVTDAVRMEIFETVPDELRDIYFNRTWEVK